MQEQPKPDLPKPVKVEDSPKEETSTIPIQKTVLPVKKAKALTKLETLPEEEYPEEAPLTASKKKSHDILFGGPTQIISRKD